LEKRVEQVLPGRSWVGGMDTHVSKCKNDKIKKAKKENIHPIYFFFPSPF
jgi:hypothetical protein